MAITSVTAAEQRQQKAHEPISQKDQNVYDLGLNVFEKTAGPRQQATDWGCSQTSGCTQTSSGCTQTSCGCYGTQRGC